jgi:SAM-dependent methyltransferase
MRSLAVLSHMTLAERREPKLRPGFMDLSERGSGGGARHPWETARVGAIESLVRSLALPRPRVLDVGCGDGYLVRELKRRLPFADVVAQDVHMSDALISELSSPGVRFVRELEGLEYRAELILMLDVLEHVQHAEQLLRNLTRAHLAPGGSLVITVPAFQWLHSHHDRALRHFRRYSRRDLIATVQAAGLDVQESGYLFSTLLLPRLASAVRDRFRSGDPKEAKHGVGGWSASPGVTELLHRVLSADNAVCLAAQRRGIVLPGLSVWLTCKASS